ncbi:MAG: hypothetical protein GY859_12315 [Desulfobacterales bacterium]|nr:hypothetical protein [Desulfobacterales bacterium]
MELFNPGGSIKDRPAPAMIEAAERKGKLTKCKTVLEATSDAAGIGLSMIRELKPYKLLFNNDNNWLATAGERPPRSGLKPAARSRR